MPSSEPPRLRIPKRTASAEITSFRQQARELLTEPVSDEETAEAFRRSFERWRSNAREFLQNAYTTDGPADEFFTKARRPSVARVGRATWRDRHPRVVENLKEGENVLASLYERLDRVPLAEQAESVDSGAMTRRLRRPRMDVELIIDRAIESAEKLLAAAGEVNAASYEKWVHDTERWHALTRDGLIAMYESGDPAEEFYNAATGGIYRQVGQDEDETFQYRQEATRKAINTLQSLRERLDFAESPFIPSPAGATPAAAAVGGGVFLVHGHDNEAKQTVARFIEKVTKPGVTILEEQADKGRTLIEKFEDHAAEMGYAVVLLTGDDEGRKIGSGDDLTPRARQNVVLELGFFIGALGRGRVAMLFSEGVELPSDVAGVLYLPIDPGGAWKIKLAREMRAAGVPVDADAVLGS